MKSTTRAEIFQEEHDDFFKEKWRNIDCS